MGKKGRTKGAGRRRSPWDAGLARDHAAAAAIRGE
eukprot:CAMPEP_0171268926 /NCGR_PEP_ID=MMETSP0790-20130122/59928_1 /TAXON_ID=2925 /ORGANISM="Alexandrium catenella, Strain OF101" /LENGTH=34 /DNA_ID= /DNA_START= /DNA_END= /DNA_ORIENTATION=